MTRLCRTKGRVRLGLGLARVSVRVETLAMAELTSPAPLRSGAPFGPSEGTWSRWESPVAYSQSFWFSIEISIGAL